MSVTHTNCVGAQHAAPWGGSAQPSGRAQHAAPLRNCMEPLDAFAAFAILLTVGAQQAVPLRRRVNQADPLTNYHSLQMLFTTLRALNHPSRNRCSRSCCR